MATNELDPTDLCDWSRPTKRAKAEAICLGRALMPDEATFVQTTTTLIIMVVWAAIVLGPMFGVADPPRYEILIGITAIVFTILGRMWDFEVQRALGAIRLPDGGRRDDRKED